jgi:hypothetical protein
MDNVQLVSEGSFDGFLARADSNGSIMWAKKIGGKFNDNITSLVIDSQGNSIVSGYFQKKIKSGETTLESDFYKTWFIAKFDSTGRQLWIKKFDRNNKLTHCRLTKDYSGNLYFAGNFQDTLISDN